jgi:hypothetical protein
MKATPTSLPAAARVIRQGQVLYTTDLTDPVVLLYGSVPDWRTLGEGVTGADMTQLNHDLVNLGYADSADISTLGWDYFSWETKAAVEALQSAVGISSPSGSLAARSVVFEPEAIRVTSVLGSLGNPAAGPVLSGTSDRHVVSIALNTSDESEVAVGDSASIQLPDGASTPGKISSVGTVASGSGSSATVPVTAACGCQAVLSQVQLDQAQMMYDDDKPTLLETGGLAIRRTCLRCLTQIKPRAQVGLPSSRNRWVPDAGHPARGRGQAGRVQGGSARVGPAGVRTSANWPRRPRPACHRKCHEFETDLGDIIVRQPRMLRLHKINMSSNLSSYIRTLHPLVEAHAA